MCVCLYSSAILTMPIELEGVFVFVCVCGRDRDSKRNRHGVYNEYRADFREIVSVGNGLRDAVREALCCSVLQCVNG